jgi:hypothetical protein
MTPDRIERQAFELGLQVRRQYQVETPLWVVIALFVSVGLNVLLILRSLS